ncbi:hypothetical protein DMENIID0001_027410 [Sergentomyia squamirostris]
MKIFHLFLFATLVWTIWAESYVEEIFKWKKVTYQNLPQSANSYVGPYKYYIPENNDIASIAYHPASGLMIANIIRVRPGIPATLAAFCVNEYSVGSSPALWGFPNYEVNALIASDFQEESDDDDDDDTDYRYHKKPIKYGQNYHYHGSHNYFGGHPIYQQKPYYTLKPITTKSPPQKPYYGLKRIVSTYATTVSEKCNRAYTIDVGVLNYYGNSTTVIQKPAILVFDIPLNCCETRNFPLVRKSIFPDDIANNVPFGILFFTLDYQSEDCDDFFMYITNPYAVTIIVYDYKRDDFWFFNNHPSFAPVIAESHMVFDETLLYDYPVGVFDFALGYPDEYGDRTAYFVPGASTAQFAVSTAVLKDKDNAPANYNSDDLVIMGYRGCNSQTARMAVDYTYGIVFYLELQSKRVRCWNMKKPLNPDNIGVILESSDKFLYGLSMFVDSSGYLWFNSCHIPILFFTDDPLDFTEVNAKAFRVKVSKAIRGTVCEG